MKVLTLKCLKCRYEWIPRKDRPKECPECKRRDWDGVGLVGRGEPKARVRRVPGRHSGP
jgi:primosomal protein N'